MSARDLVARRWMPRTIVALSTVRWPRRFAARVRRAFGGRGRVELFVAFDDAYSAVALVGLAARVERRRVRLVVEPVVSRGIPGDPAAEDKRRYAVLDARRLALRDRRELARDAVLDPGEVAFLAAWASSIADGPARTAFCAEAMEHLWFGSSGRVEEAPYAEMWQRHSGEARPPSDGDARRSERRMARRRLYDTPVAVVHGQWFFAHERLAQIEHRLDELGWTASA